MSETRAPIDQPQNDPAMLERLSDAGPGQPGPSKPKKNMNQTDWPWTAATLCYAMAALLPILDGSKTSSALGPCVLGIAFGFALLARRPVSWPLAAAGAALAVGSLWLGWTLVASAQSTWGGLALADRAGFLAEALRRACWAALASAGLGLWCKAPRSLGWLGAGACLGASLAMGMGYSFPGW